MQPYFFPYLGYFQLISACDHFILLDEVQYIRHGWINRNRILKPESSWQYITVPLEKHSRETRIIDIVPHRTDPWQQKILAQLRHYSKFAPFYGEAEQVVRQGLEKPFRNITELNRNCAAAIFDYVGLPFQYSISSNRSFDYRNVSDAGDWALRISEQMNATCYINPLGGTELFDSEKFRQSGIKLKFLKPVLPEYNQKRSSFENALSVIDLLMFHSPEELRQFFLTANLIDA